MGFIVGFFDDFFRDHSDLSWWRRDPDQWIYPAQALLCLGLLVFWWKHFDFNWSPKGIVIGAVMGAVGVTGDTSDNDAAAPLAGVEAAGLIGEA